MKFVLIAAVFSLALTQVSSAGISDSKAKRKETFSIDVPMEVQNFLGNKQQEFLQLQEQMKAAASNFQSQARPVMEDFQRKMDNLFSKIAEQAQRSHQHQRHRK
ncbi:type-4 ice-structuring protein-like [Nothobranchius furzeri]|uniref:Type-4 ice-structuring protein-like n=1 Tax=Nothobranchius furzeri TaxID=105023 RepID=A0A9D2Y030_NOTFU|nr:type-4 ice-structuring protein-like [Nothobranchius furzeri]